MAAYVDLKDHAIFKEMGGETLRRLCVFFQEPPTPLMRPLVSIIFMLSQFSGNHNQVYHTPELVDRFAEVLLCGINTIVEELSFAISNFIVESKFMASLYFHSDFIEALVNLIHQRKNPAIVHNALLCLKHLGETFQTDEAWRDFIMDYHLVGQLMDCLHLHHSDVKYGVVDLLFELVNFDREDELKVRAEIRNHPNFPIIRDSLPSEGDVLMAAVQSLIELLSET